MRHGVAGRKFSRQSDHRKAMLGNLATSLLKHGQIKTTLAKAKDLRRVVEPLITKAKKGDLAARREVMKTVTEKGVVARLFDEIAPAFKARNGGYTRVLKAGWRQGDAADMAIIELVDQPKAAAPAKAEGKETAKKAAPAKEAKAADKGETKAKAAAAKPAAKAKKAKTEEK
ncbi:MAG: 50S ribosomal protein L17 [Proteobacteria bacterium]|nr:50S ribosomal protein L17 [Pseudomonadota bacterium]